MNVTVLTENSAGEAPGVVPEFGLSLLIEGFFGRVLLDTGSSGLFARNADALGVDLAGVDWLVLSHGHSDHGGGLATFLERNERAPIVLCRGAELPHYGTLAPGLPGLLHRTRLVTRDISLDPRALALAGDRLRWLEADTWLAPGVRVLPHVPVVHAPAAGNRFLLTREGGRFVPDTFDHELLLAIVERDEAVLFSGCSHRGLLNQLEAVRRDLAGVPVRAVVGGFHLSLPRSERMAISGDQARVLARELRDGVTGTIHTGHCTGAEAFGVLAAELGPKLQALATGQRFDA
jgi:7,8-dihydropterin-6-yl-methyl-4-(beta-D-ribofuranosyl)aminobenzene 5'-phosphate synthase